MTITEIVRLLSETARRLGDLELISHVGQLERAVAPLLKQNAQLQQCRTAADLASHQLRNQAVALGAFNALLPLSFQHPEFRIGLGLALSDSIKVINECAAQITPLREDG